MEAPITLILNAGVERTVGKKANVRSTSIECENKSLACKGIMQQLVSDCAVPVEIGTEHVSADSSHRVEALLVRKALSQEQVNSRPLLPATLSWHRRVCCHHSIGLHRCCQNLWELSRRDQNVGNVGSRLS